MKTHIPIQHRKPNTFICNKEFVSDCCTIRRAFFKDKKGRIRSVVAQVIWTKPYQSKLSDFVHNTTDAERKEIYNRVVDSANAKQKALVEMLTGYILRVYDDKVIAKIILPEDEPIEIELDRGLFPEKLIFGQQFSLRSDSSTGDPTPHITMVPWQPDKNRKRAREIRRLLSKIR